MSDFVTATMKNDRVWRWVAIDGIDKASFQKDESARYFIYDSYGFVMFRACNPIMCEIHIAMNKSGPDLKEFIFDCMEKMKGEGFKKFLAIIGAWNKPAIRLAQKCGYQLEGKVTNAYLRNGQYCDMLLFGSQ